MRKGTHARPCGKQCEGLNKPDRGGESLRCKRTAKRGHRLCETHINALDFKATQYYITVSVKCPKKLANPTYLRKYKKVAVARLFHSVEDANTYMRINWNLIMAGVSKNHRVRSMNVSALRRKI